MKKILNKILSGLLATGLLSAGIISCNKDFPNTLEDRFNVDSAALKLGTRKALLLVLDGAVGAEVRALAPRNLTLMSDFSIYTYDALTDHSGMEAMTKERGWTNILTGVFAAKHGVTEAGFDESHLDDYPTIFTRLKQERTGSKSAAFATSPAFIDVLAKDATEKKTEAGDAAVKDAVVQALKTDEDITFIAAQFTAADKAGKSGAFLATDPGYKAAVLKTDEYIGEILDAMRARETFDNEDWLVIVTSSRGSEFASNEEAALRNAYDDTRRNSLFFVYNPRFNSQTAIRPGSIIPYLGTSPLYDGHQENSKAEVLDDDGLFDFGSEGSFTIQCKVKFKTGNYNYPAFLGKRKSFDGGEPGWLFFLEGNYWMINFGQKDQGNTQVKGQTVSDNRWHTITAVIKQEGANRMVYTYTDGVYSGNSANIAGKGNINAAVPLTIGFIPGSRFGGTNTPEDYFVTDVRIYNEALSAEYIAANYCKVSVAEDDPYHANLLGFWPATSVTGSKQLPDISGNNHPFTVKQLNAVDFSDATSNICPDISEEVYRTVPNSVDAANQLYLWFGILIDNNWKLDGKSWIPTYIDLNN